MIVIINLQQGGILMRTSKQDKKKYSLKNDYSEGAHPNILKALSKTNLEQQPGYGNDDYSKQAADLLRKKLQNEAVDIHFVSGGTQANLIVISSILKKYESVIAAETGHINTHEAGAIEAAGHKINTVESKNGKLSPEDIKPVLNQHTDEHMVQPKLVFISNPTELGTVYTKQELVKLNSFCKENDLLLYLDGARLGSALCSSKNDLTLSELSELVDVFYIGGTKNGALCGEAVIIPNDQIKENFRFHLKQKGALLAKGRVLGIQFFELFKDGLYFSLAEHANSMADKLSQNIERLGYQFLNQTDSNQIFPIFAHQLIEKLKDRYSFHIWKKVRANKSAVRLVTSWATQEKMIDRFISDLEKYS